MRQIIVERTSQGLGFVYIGNISVSITTLVGLIKHPLFNLCLSPLLKPSVIIKALHVVSPNFFFSRRDTSLMVKSQKGYATKIA